MHRLDEINGKLDNIQKDITDIKVLDAVQNEQLAQHMARTGALEKRVEQVDARIDPLEESKIKIHTAIKIFLGLITFFEGLPHAERFFKWLATFF